MNIKYYSENAMGRAHFGDMGTNGMVMLQWLSKKWGVQRWTGFNWHKTGFVGRI
jgi:hypothetical protein